MSQDQPSRHHRDPLAVFKQTFCLEHCTAYSRNDPGITQDKNRQSHAARTQFPWTRLAPTWQDYNALQRSYPKYDARSFEAEGEMTSELPTTGLLTGQLHSGLVEGSVTFVHNRSHRQGNLDRRTDTYFNSNRFSVPPAHREEEDVLRGHILDAAGRVRAGGNYLHGVVFPFHKRFDEIWDPVRLRNFREDVPRNVGQ